MSKAKPKPVTPKSLEQAEPIKDKSLDETLAALESEDAPSLEGQRPLFEDQANDQPQVLGKMKKFL